MQAPRVDATRGFIFCVGLAGCWAGCGGPESPPSPPIPTGPYRQTAKLTSPGPGLRLKPGEPIAVAGEFATEDPAIWSRSVIVATLNAAKTNLGDVAIRDESPRASTWRFGAEVKAPAKKGRYVIRATCISSATDAGPGAQGSKAAKTEVISASFEVL